jgi:hypothetical protein
MIRPGFRFALCLFPSEHRVNKAFRNTAHAGGKPTEFMRHFIYPRIGIFWRQDAGRTEDPFWGKFQCLSDGSSYFTPDFSTPRDDIAQGAFTKVSCALGQIVSIPSYPTHPAAIR